MTTYNTYQEAKIANPNSEIVTTASGWDGDINLTGKFEALVPHRLSRHHIDRSSWEICKPADYCMTMKDFLDCGHKLDIDDLWIDFNGDVTEVEGASLKSSNIPQVGDNDRYILRAKALEDKMKEEIKCESPMLKKLKDMQKQDRYNCINNLFNWGFITEKEKNEAIAACEVYEIKIGMTCSDDGVGGPLTSGTGGSPKKEDAIEWDGSSLPPVGVECVFYPDNTYWGFKRIKPHRGKVLHYEGEQFVFMLDHKLYEVKPESIILSRTDKGDFHKPETESQRLERERLGAAVDIYGEAFTFDSFKADKDAVKRWLTILDETKYTKGK